MGGQPSRSFHSCGNDALNLLLLAVGSVDRHGGGRGGAMGAASGKRGKRERGASLSPSIVIEVQPTPF